jgi:hypothetical protein
MFPRSRLAATATVAVSSWVLAAPAGATPGDLRSPDAVDAASSPAQDLRSPDAAAAGDAARTTDAAPTSVVASVSSAEPSPGFEWGSAGIGAAGTVGLVAVAVGGGMTVRRRRS